MLSMQTRKVVILAVKWHSDSEVAVISKMTGKVETNITNAVIEGVAVMDLQ